jgi:hypothetical protein
MPMTAVEVIKIMARFDIDRTVPSVLGSVRLVTRLSTEAISGCTANEGRDSSIKPPPWIARPLCFDRQQFDHQQFDTSVLPH